MRFEPVLLLFFAVQHRAQDNCRPMWFPTTYEYGPLYIYRESDVREVKVYNCRYVKETSYHTCLNGSLAEVIRVDHENYSDITRMCLDVEKTGYYYDRYGGKHTNDTINKPGVTYTTSCIDGGYSKLVELTRKKHIATADLTTNEIILPSGSVCKYDYGFCYDKIAETNFVWEVTSPPPPHSMPDCDNLKKYTVENGFFLKIGRYYSVSRVDGGFGALELVDAENYTVCNVPVRVGKNKMFVSKENITNAKPSGPLEKKKYTAHFEEEEKLFDYLVRVCRNDISYPQHNLARSTLETSVALEKTVFHIEKNENKAKEQEILLRGLRDEIEDLRNQLWLAAVTIVVCAFFFGCKIAVKYIIKVKNNRKKEVTSNLVKNGDYYDGLGAFSVQTYETIGSEYDVNTFYHRK